MTKLWIAALTIGLVLILLLLVKIAAWLWDDIRGDYERMAQRE